LLRAEQQGIEALEANRLQHHVDAFAPDEVETASLHRVLPGAGGVSSNTVPPVERAALPPWLGKRVHEPDAARVATLSRTFQTSRFSPQNSSAAMGTNIALAQGSLKALKILSLLNAIRLNSLSYSYQQRTSGEGCGA
jgi:hypothetical protein